MKMHKIELYVIDFENLGVDEYKDQLSNMKHMSGQIKAVETSDIGEWNDAHVLNKTSTNADIFRSYFVTQRDLNPIAQPVQLTMGNISDFPELQKLIQEKLENGTLHVQGAPDAQPAYEIRALCVVTQQSQPPESTK